MMKADFELIKKITCGAVEIIDNDGVYEVVIIYSYNEMLQSCKDCRGSFWVCMEQSSRQTNRNGMCQMLPLI